MNSDKTYCNVGKSRSATEADMNSKETDCKVGNNESADKAIDKL